MLKTFGGVNGELKLALQYFVQAFACHGPYPDKYDMLMDIASEGLAHLKVVGTTIQMLLGSSNFPLGVLQTDPRYSNLYFNISVGKDSRGPWNEGPYTQMLEEWLYIKKPIEQVCATDGELTREPSGTRRMEVREKKETLSRQKSQEVLKCVSAKETHWCNYEHCSKCCDK